MVTVDYYKLTRILELYLLKQAKNILPISGYKLIALMPVDPNSWVDRQTLLLSLPEEVKDSKRKILQSIFTLLKSGLSESEYLDVYTIDLLDANSFTVQRLNNWEHRRLNEIVSVPISIIGGVSQQNITVIRTSVLEKLAYNTLRRFYLIDDSIFSGELNDIQLLDNDAQLNFKLGSERTSCSFTEIVKIESI